MALVGAACGTPSVRCQCRGLLLLLCGVCVVAPAASNGMGRQRRRVRCERTAWRRRRAQAGELCSGIRARHHNGEGCPVAVLGAACGAPGVGRHRRQPAAGAPGASPLAAGREGWGEGGGFLKRHGAARKPCNDW